MIGQAIGAGLGLINGALNRDWSESMYKRSTRDNRQNMAIEYNYNEKAAQNAQNRSEEFFRKYQTPEAMKRMLKEAGLSIGLMYGMNGGMGGGSATTGQQGGTSGQGHGQIMSAPMDIASYINTMSNAKLADAQAGKIKTETDEMLGKTQKGSLTIETLEANIDSIVAETNNKKEQRALYKAETKMKGVLTQIEELNLEKASVTFEDGVKAIGLANQQMEEEIRSLRNSNEITEAQKGALKVQVKLVNQKIIDEILNLRTERQLDKTKIKELTPLIEKAWNDARTSKWQSINEERAYEMFHDKLMQSERFKELDLDTSTKNTLIKGLFTALGGFMAFSKK